MKVYVVITNGEEIKGQVEGVYTLHDKAKEKFQELVWELREWAKGGNFEEDEDLGFYCQTNYDEDEYNEVKIVERELE